MMRQTMEDVMNNDIDISGPYREYHRPYGTVTGYHDEWFVSRRLSDQELKTASPMQQILKTKSLGVIHQPKNQKRFVISQLYPNKEYKTLRGAINFLIRSECKLVFCT